MIYLLHATKNLGTVGRGSASHYLGYCEEDKLWQRLSQHGKNRSHVAIIRAFHRVGAELLLVRVWPNGTRDDERHLKKSHHVKQLCPECNPSWRSWGQDVGSAILSSPPRRFFQLSAVPRNTALAIPLSGTPLDKSGSSRVLPVLGGLISSGATIGAVAHFPSTSRSSAAAKPSKVGPISSAGTSAPSNSGSTSGSRSAPSATNSMPSKKVGRRTTTTT